MYVHVYYYSTGRNTHNVSVVLGCSSTIQVLLVQWKTASEVDVHRLSPYVWALIVHDGKSSEPVHLQYPLPHLEGLR